MNRVLCISPVLLALVACGGGGSSTVPNPTATTTAATPPVTPSFKIQTSIKSAATTPSARLNALFASPDASITNTDVAFGFAFEARQSGAMVVGYSAKPDWSMSFNVSTLASDGTTVLGWDGSQSSQGVSETFAISDPAIVLPAHATALVGPTAAISYPQGSDYGIFMTRFQPTGSTLLNVTSSSTTTESVDEIVVRLANPTESLVDTSGNPATLVSGPHFIYNGTLYTDSTGYGSPRNLSLGSGATTATPFANFQYIFFMPASKIGAGASFSVLGTNTVISPVTGDFDTTLPAPYMTPSSTWQPKDVGTWLTDTGCAGILAVVQGVNGETLNPSVAAASLTVADLALGGYFQAFFTKFYAADSTMFNNTHGRLGNNGSLSATFEIIALDDSAGPMSLTAGATLNLVFDPTAATYDLASGTNGNNTVSNILNLQGNPPIKFTTSISTPAQ
jgi:hypothetical protein